MHNRCVLWCVYSCVKANYFRKQIAPSFHTYPLKSRPLHISHTSVILNFAKYSLDTFDWTKLKCVAYSASNLILHTRVHLYHSATISIKIPLVPHNAKLTEVHWSETRYAFGRHLVEVCELSKY